MESNAPQDRAHDVTDFFLFGEAGENTLRDVLLAFDAAGDLRPVNAIAGDMRSAFDPAAIVEQLRQMPNLPMYLSLDSPDESQAQYAVTFLDAKLSGRVRISGSVTMQGALPLVNLLCRLAETIRAEYGAADIRADFKQSAWDPGFRPKLPPAPPDVFWFNLFGPDLALQIGSVDGVRRIPLSYGGAALLTSDNPNEYAQPQVRTAQAKLFAALHPDVARATEWVPLGDAPPSNVPDPHKAERRLSVLSEELIAGLGHEIPELNVATPEALLALDHYAWRRNFPALYSPQQIEGVLTPSVGAFLGHLMVKYLGGEWICREDLFECTVALSDRAWQPFLRAQHFLVQRQDAIDRSLWKYFQEARRSGVDVT
jgi:hypothetical protein